MNDMSAPVESRGFHLSVPSVFSAVCLINAGQALVMSIKEPIANVAAWFINYGVRNRDVLLLHPISISWQATFLNLGISAASLVFSLLIASWSFRRRGRRT